MADDLHAGGPSPASDARITPPLELPILDQQHQAPDVRGSQCGEVRRQVAPVDPPGISGGWATLPRQNGHAQPSGELIIAERPIHPVDAQWPVAHQFSRLVVRVQK